MMKLWKEMGMENLRVEEFSIIDNTIHENWFGGQESEIQSILASMES